MILNWLTIAFCTVFFVLSLKRVFSDSFSALNLASIVFFVMQVVPIFVESFWGYDDFMFFLKNMYYASQDQSVHYVYCIFVCVTMALFWVVGEYLCQKRVDLIDEECNHYQANIYLFFFLLLGILSPVIALIGAPDPSIYLTFARFYKYTFNPFDASVLYYMVVIKHVVYFAFLSTILLYFFNDDKNKAYNFIVLIGVILITWFEGKRSFLIFSLMAIIAVDIIRNRYVEQRGKLIIKAAVFTFISVIFFVIYKEYTGKNVDTDFLSQYNQYYSRMACVKTAIYSVLQGESVLQYPGQSFLYDVFFFVPRGFWPEKPAMFVKYFTAYAMNRKNLDFLSWNLITNMWCEFIANIGVIGYVLGVALTTLVAKITDLTSNIFVRMWGMIFIALYFMFGFEYLVLIVYIAFIVSLVAQKVRERV